MTRYFALRAASRPGVSYVLLLATSALFAFAALSESLGQDHRAWIEGEVAAIATQQEVRDYARLTTDEDRVAFQEIFWLRRDPDLSTPDNEYRATFDERVEVADDSVPGAGSGSRSDMGRVFILFGYPSEVEYSRETAGNEPRGGQSLHAGAEDVPGSTSEHSSAAPASLPRLQTWSYAEDSPLNLGYGLTLEFRVAPAFGYRLVEDPALEELAESMRNDLIEHPDIGYAFDAEGRLLPAEVPAGPALAGSLLEELMTTGATSDALPLAIMPAFFRSDAESTYVPMLLELVDAGSYEELTFFGVVQDEDGEVVSRFVERATPDSRGELRLEMPFQLAPGEYTAHLGVVDGDSGLHGSRVETLTVPEFSGETLQLSTLLAYRRVAPTNSPAGVPGQAFQFATTKLDPAGAQAFGQDESLGIFFFVYGVKGANVTAEYAFYQGDNELTKTEPGPLPSGNGLALGSDEIPLARFEPGEYEVRVRVNDVDGGETREARLRFELRQ